MIILKWYSIIFLTVSVLFVGIYENAKAGRPDATIMNLILWTPVIIYLILN